MNHSDKFIMSTDETWCAGKLVINSVSIMFYNDAEGKFERKTFFSYGFVNDEAECLRSDNDIKFDVTMKLLQKQFAGTRWRSFIRKISDDEVAVGLEVAKEGELFRLYGEEILVRKT